MHQVVLELRLLLRFVSYTLGDKTVLVGVYPPPNHPHMTLLFNTSFLFTLGKIFGTYHEPTGQRRRVSPFGYMRVPTRPLSGMSLSR